VKWNYRIIYFLVIASIFVLFSFVDVFSQVSKELDKKKMDNIEKLKYSRCLLEKTAEKKSITLNQLNLIQENISLGSAIVSNISEELKFLKNDIEENNVEIKKIELRITNLKNEYAQLIVAASRNLDKDFALMYIFSSQDFNQAYQRVKYLKFLARYREELVAKLSEEEFNLQLRTSELLLNRKSNERLLIEQKKELLSLDKDKVQSIAFIKKLKSQEAELKKEILNRERIQADLEREIRKIIEEEARKSREANKAGTLTAEEKLISSDFSKNRGKLPWPSEKGLLTGKYGEQDHPVLKGIKIKSNGIDISTLEGSSVRCVFDGQVTKVVAILGANYTVIIRHGEYRTVYQNLVDVKVKAGDKVKSKDVIGTVFTDKENISKIHFEIWMNKETQNPESWLSR
jgi:septal ring factor EnvC (AmiA/AmiB activator)